MPTIRAQLLPYPTKATTTQVLCSCASSHTTITHFAIHRPVPFDLENNFYCDRDLPRDVRHCRLWREHNLPTIPPVAAFHASGGTGSCGSYPSAVAHSCYWMIITSSSGSSTVASSSLLTTGGAAGGGGDVTMSVLTPYIWNKVASRK